MHNRLDKQEEKDRVGGGFEIDNSTILKPGIIRDLVILGRYDERTDKFSYSRY